MSSETKTVKERAKEIVKAFVFVGVGLVADTVKDVILDHVAPKRLLGEQVNEQIWNAIDHGARGILVGLIPEGPQMPLPPRPDPYRSREYYASEIRGRRLPLIGPPQPQSCGPG